MPAFSILSRLRLYKSAQHNVTHHCQGSSGIQRRATFTGVANSVLPKIQLNECTQKLSLPAPSYEFTKEGPSHNPRFRASVLVNGKIYDSQSEFFTSKEAMHDAARVALEDLNAKGTTSVPNSVCETGQWKNALQQHAQKLKLPLPTYTCEKGGDDHSPIFISTVEVGGISCTGGIATNKKAAEMKAAKKAFLVILICQV